MTLARQIYGLSDFVGAGAVGQGIQHADDGSDSFRDSEVINVREYRIVGDGTDERAKIQSLFDAIQVGMVEGSQKRRRVFFPEPQGSYYRINGSLRPPKRHIRLQGAERTKCEIRQFTADTPILIFDDATVTNPTRNIEVRGLSLAHNAIPTALTTQQYGIQFRSSTDGLTANGNAYGMVFEDLLFYNSYVGIGGWAAAAPGAINIWSSHWENIIFWSTFKNAVKLNNLPSVTSIGQPHNTFTNIAVLNYDPLVVNVGTDVEGGAFSFIGTSGVVMNNINIEDWRDKLIFTSGINYIVINGLRTERIRVTAAGSLVAINGPGVINGALFAIAIQHPSGVVRLIHAQNANGKVAVNAIQAAKDTTYSTTTQAVALLAGTGGAEIYANGIIDDDANNIKIFQTVTVGDQHGVVWLNGRPPYWSALPTASSTYRGRMARIEGGAGVADTLQICEKNAADAYVWRAY